MRSMETSWRRETTKTSKERNSEQERLRIQQREYYNSLSDQVRSVTNRKRFEDMMTNQERQLNQKNIQAYESMEPVLYSNKIGYHNSPNKQVDLGKIINNQSYNLPLNGIQKLNVAQTGAGNLLAPEIPLDLK